MKRKEQMRHIRNSLLVLVLLALIEPGCRPVTSLVTSQNPYRTDYLQALEKWTREARVYRGLDMELICSATFKSAAYRSAYVKEYAATYLLTPEAELKLEEDQATAGAEFHDFVMATSIPDHKWNDFDQKDSMWKISLSNDSNDRIESVEIRELDKKDPVIGEFFPYVSPWRYVYSLRFPVRIPEKNKDFISPDTRFITLTVTGVKGTCHMTWGLMIDSLIYKP
jgi:hypothetical protein